MPASPPGERLPPHPYYVFVELVSDLRSVAIEAREVIDWAKEQKQGRRRLHLARLAIINLAFMAQTSLELRSFAGKLTKDFNTFAADSGRPRRLRPPATEHGKALREHASRLRPYRNLIAHPYRVAKNPQHWPMAMATGLALAAVLNDLPSLADCLADLEAAYRDLEDWCGEAFAAGLTRTDWLGGGRFATSG